MLACQSLKFWFGRLNKCCFVVPATWRAKLLCLFGAAEPIVDALHMNRVLVCVPTLQPVRCKDLFVGLCHSCLTTTCTANSQIVGKLQLTVMFTIRGVQD